MDFVRARMFQEEQAVLAKARQEQSALIAEATQRGLEANAHNLAEDVRVAKWRNRWTPEKQRDIDEAQRQLDRSTERHRQARNARLGLKTK